MDADSTDQKPIAPNSATKSNVSNGSSSTMPLRPCQVCLAQSSGYHFGVISCEACKSFYRRTMKLKLEYTCLSHEAGNCNLRQVKGAKPPCPACRFKKCVALGMSLDAAKKGRYSHAKRVETVRETAQYWKNQGDAQTGLIKVKTEPFSECEEQMCSLTVSDGISSNFSPSSSSFPPIPTPPPFTEQFPFKDIQGDACSPQQSSNEEKMPHLENETNERTDQDAMRTQQDIAPVLTPGSSTSGDSDISDDISRYLKEDVIKESVELDKFSDIVVDAYDRQNFLSKGFIAQVPIVVHRYLVEQHCKMKKFPVQEPISNERHRRVFRETGVDLDGRLEMFKYFINSTQELVTKTTGFCMEVPGFVLIENEDRIQLIKRGKLEMLQANLYPVHLFDEGIVVLPTKDIISKEFMYKLHSREIIDESFSLAKRLQDLNFNERENALFAAFILVNPDRCLSVRAKKICRSIREHAAQCLRQSLKKRIAADKLLDVLCEISDIGNELAILSVQHNEESDALMMNQVPGVSSLMREMFNKDDDPS